MKSTKLVSILAAATIFLSSAPIYAQAANSKAIAKGTVYTSAKSVKSNVTAAANGVYTVKKMPYNYNAKAAASITVRGNKNQSSSYKISKGTTVCVINVLKLKGTTLYETVYKTGSKYIHGYVPAGSLNFRYQSWYTSINKQPVYSLNGKTKVAYLNKNQKATKLYMVGKKCAVLFDTASGKNTGIGLVNYSGSKF